MTYQLSEISLCDVREAGLVRKRLLGGHGVTLKGTRYLRDACARNEKVRREMSQQADGWAEGKMSKAEKREGLVALVRLAWEQDPAAEGEALDWLRELGFDPTKFV
jgi:hypothetical protein